MITLNFTRKMQNGLLFLVFLGFFTHELSGKFGDLWARQRELVADVYNDVVGNQGQRDLGAQQLAVQIEETDTQVLIKVSGIYGENFEATVNDQKDQIEIVAPTDVIVVNFKKMHDDQGYISVDAKQTINSEKKKEEQQGAVSTQMYTSTAHANYGRMLNGAIDTDAMMKNVGQLINYSPEKVVSIVLPKIANPKKKTKGTQVPVTVLPAKAPEVSEKSK